MHTVRCGLWGYYHMLIVGLNDPIIDINTQWGGLSNIPLNVKLNALAIILNVSRQYFSEKAIK